MKSAVAGCLLGLALVLLLAFSGTPNRADRLTPLLGRVWSHDQMGYGQARPTTIFNGGDPTGLVENVHWRSWGGPRATATGFSYYPHESVADSTREAVEVVAFEPGTCHGKNVYEAIEWYFPGHGQRFDPNNYINICTGDYIGG